MWCHPIQKVMDEYYKMEDPVIELPNILVSIRVSVGSLSIWFPILYITFIYKVNFFITKSFPYYTRISIPSIKSFTLMIISKQRRKKKKKGNEEDEQVFHLVSYKWIRKTQVIPEFGGFYKNVGILLGGLQRKVVNSSMKQGYNSFYLKLPSIFLFYYPLFRININEC